MLTDRLLLSLARIQTSYVTVEPKRRKQAPALPGSPGTAEREGSSGFLGPLSESPPDSQTRRASSGRELRRARIVITVRRTSSYKKWLEENPLQAIIAGDVEDDSGVDHSMDADHD